MIRNLKVMGLALVAMLAMAGLSAASASAAESFHHTSEENARVIASNAGQGNHSFTAGVNGTISCTNATFTGTEYVGPSEPTVTVAPAYSGCTFLGIANVKVNMSGCTYEFETPAEKKGSVQISCPEGQRIHFEASACKVEVGPQTVGTVSYTNQATSPESVKVTSNVTKIAYTASLGCALPGNFSNGTYSGSAVAFAETEFEEIVGAYVE